MKLGYSSIETILILHADEPYNGACLRILDDNRELFRTVQGSTNNHQAWRGGYYDHVTEILNIAVVLYPVLQNCRPLPFSLSDALVALYFHDIEKPWKYELGPDGQLYHKPELDSKSDQHEFKLKKIREYGLELPAEIRDAIKYAEGELGDYNSRRRVMSPLAAFCHMCDVWSARGWFDYPDVKNDPWQGARRTNP